MLAAYGSLGKDKRYFSAQVKLFRDCDPRSIAGEAKLIHREWESVKRDLNGRMVNSVIGVAEELSGFG